MSAPSSHATLIAEIVEMRRENVRLSTRVNEPEDLAAELALPKCGECGAVAVCLGRSLDPPETATEWSYGCDECCGHGDEDSECVPLDGIPKRVTRLQKQIEELDNAGATDTDPSGLHPSQSSGAGDRQLNGQAGPGETPADPPPDILSPKDKERSVLAVYRAAKGAASK